jgi:hypothetical protein
MTYLHVFQTILLCYAAQDILLTALLHFSCEQQLIEDEVCLLEVEYDVKFTDVAIVFVHLFDVAMDDFKGDQFIVFGVAASNEEEGSVTTIDDFAV